MKLNLIRFKVAARKRNDKKENLPIGSAIKFKRRQLHMTLEEAAKDICSISYLSKLENNIIVPNDLFVDQLRQRFYIDEDDEIDDTYYQTVKKQLLVAMLNDQKINVNLVDIAQIPADYQTLLLQFGVYVLHHKTKEIYETYQKVTSVVSSMPDEEFAILICLISRILYDEARYQEMNEILAMINMENIDDIIKLYRDRMILITAVHTDNTAAFHMNYPKYQRQLLYLGYYKQINELRQQMLIYLAGITNINDYQVLLNQNRRIPAKFKYFVKSINYLANGEYAHVIKQTHDQLDRLDNKWYIIRLIALDATGDKKALVNSIKVENNRTFTHNQLLLFNFLKAKNSYSKEALLIYLRTVILGDNFLTDDVRILSYLQKQSHRLFKAYFYYKEAAEVYTKFNYKIETLKRSNQIIGKELKSSFFMQLRAFEH